MRRLHITRRRAAVGLVSTILLLACLGLTACGGSTSTTTAAASTAPTGAAGPAAGRFSAMRECLQKQGITLPQRKPGQGRPPGGRGSGGGFFLGGGGGARLPKGVTPAQFRAALQKCGGGKFARGRRFASPAARAALVKFAACMRQNGVNLPAPSSTGGPIFNTRGISTSSAAFKAAEAKCRGDLPSGLLGRRPGGPPPTTG